MAQNEYSERAFNLKNIGYSVKNYLEISKPRSVVLLYFTSLVSILIASTFYGYSPKIIIIISLAVILAVMGANASTNYIDRKIDSLMDRTKKRAIASGKISPPLKGLVFALLLVAAGIILALYVNWLSALFIFLGFLDSAVLYNGITKRRSRFNILYGSAAGGFPVLAGWTAVSGGRIDLLAIIMFSFIIIWTPAHIWSLAYFYREDYMKADVPMLPVFLSEKQNHALLSILNLLMIIAASAIFYIYNLSLVYFFVNLAFSLALIAVIIIMLVKSSRKYAWILFKLSSPYLAVVFLLLLVEFIVLK